jgi:hypothetical protein
MGVILSGKAEFIPARRRTGRDDRKKENGAGRSRAVGIR